MKEFLVLLGLCLVACGLGLLAGYLEEVWRRRDGGK